MSYIGNSPTTQAFVTDQFSGTGSQTAFTMSVAPAATSAVLVAISGVLQDPSTYSVAGTTLTFSAAPPSGTGNISARYLGIPASGVATTAYRTLTEFTATSGQTTFSVPSYVAGFINVFRNGAMLGTADYTATNGTTVVLAVGAVAGDLIAVESFYVSSVLNAIPNTPRSVSAANMPVGAVLQVVGGSTQIASGFTTTSTSLTATGYTQTITPTAATSKILIIWNSVWQNQSSSTNGYGIAATIYRGSTNLATGSSPSVMALLQTPSISANISSPLSMQFLDSPATTSPVTYQIYGASQGSPTVCAIAGSYSLMGSGVYTFTLMEIAA